MGGSYFNRCFVAVFISSRANSCLAFEHMAEVDYLACRNTYTALNALAGHFNSFGTTAPLPKKRLERIQKELDDATKMLGRGR